MKHAPLLVAVGSLLLGACSGEAGKLGATGTGDLSNPPALRLKAGSALTQCNDLEPNVDKALSVDGFEGRLDRWPYLQNVTKSSAMVLFTADVQNPVVDLVSPTGHVVDSIDAEIDISAPTEDQWVATFDGLEPATWYCYSLRDMTGFSAFRTAPESGAESPVRFVAFGDSGGSFQDAVVEQMQTVAFDLILHTGDIAYDSGTRGQFERYFFDPYASILKSAPVFPTSGNHDYETSRAAPFREVFALPENGGANGKERWYSFDWGDVHFVALDTEQSLTEQATWLARDLERNDLRWTVAYLHRPPYSSGDHGSDERVRRAFSPIFAEHGVQLVLAGHDHDYERTRPIEGVTYVVTGGGGKNTRSVGRSSFTAFSEDVLHFVYVEVEGDTLLLHAIDGLGREFDSARIDI